MKNNKYYKYQLGIIVLSGIVESIIAILQRFSFLESNHSLFSVTGTFANPGPLGGFLAICLVVSVGLYIGRNSFGLIGTLVCLIIFVGLLLTDSRAGWIAAMSGILFLLKNKIHLSWKRKCMLSMVLLFVCVVMYLHKKVSADGRLLIWYCTMVMIADKAFLGYGSNGWIANYMYYQAKFFEEHPNSDYAMVADNAAYPYNEFLWIWTEYGIIGLVLVVGLIYWGIAYKSHNRYAYTFRATLVCFTVFACFSYPFHLLLSDTPQRMDIAAQNSFMNDPPEKALEVMEEAAKIIPTCELFCDMGDTYRKLNQYKKAEQCYQLATNMIPSRITPKYKLFVLYKDSGDSLSAVKIANEIMTMKIKIEGSHALKMKGLVRMYLLEH